jgi:DNA polymerase III alpha subunit (gram-positive type)
MRAFVFDTETSGLIDTHRIPLKKQPEIIEFYGATVNPESGEIFGEIDQLIKPAKEISEEITRITHITNDMLKDAPAFGFVADKIKAAIEEADCVIAHNLSYDMEITDIEFERIGGKIAWPKRRICTVEQTIHLKGHRLNLMGLHELLFKSRFEEAHRARNDVEALIRCVVELFRRGEL